ncbi:hypothetical protein DQM28_09615 [Leptospira mayottensis]|uniref:Uncharacterized protein n=1 Tax=Leptospira mayottensis TaxID=1137606 RepID=A0ABN5NSI0_9LEPT|nr:hypothetical protein DQM28_09615 [Leptospira mayottensis]
MELCRGTLYTFCDEFRACLKISEYRNLDENLTIIKYIRKLVNYQRGVIYGDFYILLRTYRIIVTKVLGRLLIKIYSIFLIYKRKVIVQPRENPLPLILPVFY